MNLCGDPNVKSDLEISVVVSIVPKLTTKLPPRTHYEFKIGPMWELELETKWKAMEWADAYKRETQRPSGVVGGKRHIAANKRQNTQYNCESTRQCNLIISIKHGKQWHPTTESVMKYSMSCYFFSLDKNKKRKRRHFTLHIE